MLVVDRSHPGIAASAVFKTPISIKYVNVFTGDRLNDSDFHARIKRENQFLTIFGEAVTLTCLTEIDVFT
jgi:hypothetical protein